jgi:phosphatidylinositol alpha-1,6-mannosyltransferase
MPEKMKNRNTIVFCAINAYGATGGLEAFNRRVIRSLESLSRKGRVSFGRAVLLRDTQSALPKTGSVVMCASGGRRFNFVLSVIRASRGADLLLVGHINLLPAALIARAMKPSLKIVLFVHGDEVWNTPPFRQRKWFEVAALKAVAKVVAVSDHTSELMRLAFRIRKGKMYLLPNAVDPLEESQFERSDGAKIVVAVSRLESGDEPKRIDELIRAMKIVLETHPGAKCWIVGDGSLVPQLRRLSTDLGLSESVVFHGKVDNQKLSELYSKASVFVLPSIKEGFGIVYLEAWLHGLPVICSNEGASKEIVCDAWDGFVVRPAARDVAVAVNRLLADPELAKLFGERGRMKVHQKFLQQHFENNLDMVLRS